MKKHKEIDLEVDDEGHRSWHKYKIGGFWLFTFFLISVLAGFTGNGFMSNDTQTDPTTSERIETEKYTRYESPMEIRLFVNTAAAGEDSLYDISFPASYLDNYTIESILPEPEITEIEAGRNVFRFRVRVPSKDQLITFHLRSNRSMVTAKGDVWLESQAEFPVSQFIYP